MGWGGASPLTAHPPTFQEKLKNRELGELVETEQSVAKQLKEQLEQKEASLKEVELQYQAVGGGGCRVHYYKSPVVWSEQEKEKLEGILSHSTDATQKQLSEVMMGWGGGTAVLTLPTLKGFGRGCTMEISGLGKRSVDWGGDKWGME